MRATLRIMWLILSLGFLCHVCSSDSVETTTLKTNAAATTTTSAITARTTKGEKAISITNLVPVSPTALSVSAIQKNSSPTVTVTVTQTESTTVKQTVTKSSPENMTSNDSSTKVTSSNPTAITTSSQSTAMTVMPSSTNAIISVTTVPPTVAAAVPSKNVATSVTDARHAIQTSKAPTTIVTPMMNQGNNRQGSTESSESTTKESAVTTVVSMLKVVPSTSLSKTIQASTTKTPDLPEEIFTNATTTTTTTTNATTTTTTTTTTTIAPTTSPQLRVFFFSLKIKEESTDKTLEEVCKKLMVNFADGNCTLKYYKHHNGTLKINYVETNGEGNASIAQQYYEEISTIDIWKPKDNKTLIIILASSGALLIMIVIIAAYASHHRKPYNENQQHLTEELQTVENGYHDNPTLEVTEEQSEMQEKKMALNGEFNDSWIVPFDNLLKGDSPDEEDTHL